MFRVALTLIKRNRENLLACQEFSELALHRGSEPGTESVQDPGEAGARPQRGVQSRGMMQRRGIIKKI